MIRNAVRSIEKKQQHEFVLKNMAAMFNKNSQKHFPIGVRQNCCSAIMQ